MKELRRELSRCLTLAGLQGERGQAELPSRSHWYSWDTAEDQVLEARQWDRHSWLGRRRTHTRGRSGLRWQPSPSLSCLSCTSPLPLALHDPTLTNGSTTPWKTWSYNRRTGHDDEMPLHRKKRNQGSRSGLRWMRSWVLNWPASRPHWLLDWGYYPWPNGHS